MNIKTFFLHFLLNLINDLFAQNLVAFQLFTFFYLFLIWFNNNFFCVKKPNLLIIINKKVTVHSYNINLMYNLDIKSNFKNLSLAIQFRLIYFHSIFNFLLKFLIWEIIFFQPTILYLTQNIIQIILIKFLKIVWKLLYIQKIIDFLNTIILIFNKYMFTKSLFTFDACLYTFNSLPKWICSFYSIRKRIEVFFI